jgi:iron complex transport system substrate-binding protein
MPSKIVSFLPSATEMVCALGLGDALVGITHECDYPAEVKDKPVVVRAVLPIEQMNQDEIDAAVAQRMRAGLSLYAVDEELLRQLDPDLILTQDLCQVCAPSGNEVAQVLQLLPRKPQILWLTPRSLDEIFENLRELGEATDRQEAAARLIADGRARLDNIATVTRQAAKRPRVFCMEWFEPVYASGHWLPEMIEIAGGEDALGKRGADSVRVDWQAVVAWAPEVLILSPCGFNLDQTIDRARSLPSLRGWSDLPAVREAQVYAVDANSYFARPGPRVVEGTELLAHLIHAELFSWPGPDTAFRRLNF